jgi:hypothetical protein
LRCKGDDCSGPYFDYFDLPGNERYYDVQIDNLHFFILDSDQREPDGIDSDSKQARWLKQQLAASSADHKMVLFHHSPFSSGDAHGSNENLQWPFEAWGATVVMTGHEHIYERLQIGGIPYFINGSGGASLHGFDEPLPESQFQYGDDHGAMLVTVKDHEIEYQFINRQGNVIDRFVQDSSQRLSISKVMRSRDDAEEDARGTVNLESGDLEFVTDKGLASDREEQTIGIRFADVNVPANVTITKAYLDFHVDESTAEATSLTISAEASANPASFTEDPFDISSRDTLETSLSWSDLSVWESGEHRRSPELSFLVQKLIGQDGWQPNNAMVFIITGSGKRIATAFDGNAQQSPRLWIEYRY